MKIEKKFWIQGMPATFATKGENPWKYAIQQSIPSENHELSCGLILHFKVATLAPNSHPIDVDNLCEPVFSSFINKLGWFSGKRQNLRWWHATKVCGNPSGLDISVFSSTVSDMIGVKGEPFFDEVYTGLLPKSATSPEIPL